MKKITKLLLFLAISMSVNSTPLCNSTCPIKALDAKLKAASVDQLNIDENDWILNTRFKY
ncbi:MAG: hypothetical protein QM737_03720 [Ferruginibacter sp.]